MASTEEPYEAQLRRIVHGSDWLMGILGAVRDCDPPDWLVGGGVLYKLVWNRLHGYADATYVNDVDVVFFDPEDLNPKRERAVERDLLTRRPDVPWEVKNQAAVHLWYAEKFGYAVPPLGLSDLFELVLRRNPRRVTPELFHEWVVEKRIREKWPKVRIIYETRPVIS